MFRPASRASSSLRAFCLFAVLLASGAAAGCSMRSFAPEQPTVLLAAAAPPALSADRLATALAELDALAAPEGADPAQFAALKAALRAQLTASAADARAAAQLPDQTKNAVADSQVVDDGAGGWNLVWTYRNIGDYDNNGLVSISDLSPLGAHLGKTDASGDWVAARTADGDGNGVVAITDLTPIGANLGSDIRGYKVYGGASAAGPWTSLLGDAPLADAAAGFPRVFTFPLGAAPPAFILLSAYDATGADWLGGVEIAPATFDSAAVQPGAAAAIGSGGGTLDGPAGTPLEGVRITIPAGAIPDGTQVTLDYNEGTVTPAVGVWEGPVLDLHLDQPNLEFDAPLEITVPYSDSANYLPVPYYINDAGRFEGCDIKAIDEAGGTYTFYTWHASRFTTIKAAKAAPVLAEYHTRFNPEDNGFQVVNATTPFSGGQCFGHAAFAGWYYSTWKGVEPPLYNSFMYDMGGGRKGQHVLASRAQIAVSRKWGEYVPALNAQDSLEDFEVFNIIRSMMANQGAPVCLYITAPLPGATHAAHAVLAYAYDADSLKIWDSNTPHPQPTPELEFDELLGFTTFNNAGYPFDKFKYLGLGSLRVAEPFYDIFTDAREQFESADTALTSLSIQDGHSTSSFTQPLSFTVESGDILIERVQLIIHHTTDGTLEWLDGVPDGSGNCSFVIPLKPGDNEVWFDTKGFDSENALVSTRHNLRSDVFNIQCGGTVPPLRVELTWDATHGAEPGHITLAVQQAGEAHWYSTHDGTQTLPSGAQLIACVEESGGPQVFILDADDAVVYGQPYRFKWHFKPTMTWSEFTPVTMKVWIDGVEPERFTANWLEMTDWNWNDGTEPEWTDPNSAEGTQSTYGWIGGGQYILTAP